MFMLESKKPYISYADEYDMWVLEEKVFLKKGLSNTNPDHLRWNTGKYNESEVPL